MRGLAPALDTDLAVDAASREMPRDFVVAPYLPAHKAEVRDMLLTEYDEAKAMELFRQEGRDEALRGSILSLMERLHTTAQQAMGALGIPEAKRPGYLAML